MKNLIIFSLALFLSCSAVLATDPNPKLVGDIDISPSSPKVGEEVRFTVQFKLKLAPVDNLKIVAKVDNVVFWETTFPHYDPPQDFLIGRTWFANVSPGTHKVSFELDPQNIIQEYNENDNYLEKTFTVLSDSSTGPTVQKVPEGLKRAKKITPKFNFPINLAMKDFTFTFDVTQTSPNMGDYWVIWTTFDVQFKIPSEVYIYIKLIGNGKTIEKTKPLTGLSLGENKRGFVFPLSQVPPGSYVTIVMIDPMNLLKENNRNDNRLSKSINFVK